MKAWHSVHTHTSLFHCLCWCVCVCLLKAQANGPEVKPVQVCAKCFSKLSTNKRSFLFSHTHTHTCNRNCQNNRQKRIRKDKVEKLKMSIKGNKRRRRIVMTDKRCFYTCSHAHTHKKLMPFSLSLSLSYNWPLCVLKCVYKKVFSLLFCPRPKC